MAREIAEFEWTDLARPGRRAPLYPWDEWLNGKPWELTYGVDYTCKTTSLVHAARKVSRAERDGDVKWVRTGDNTIVIQFVKNPEQQEEA